MSSLSDEMDVEIEVRRRDSKYVLIAHRFGVVVRSEDLRSGVEELERRVAIIGDDLREVGVPARTSAAGATTTEMRQLDRLAPSLIIIVTVGAVLASFILLASAPIVSALASVRSGISELVPTEAGSGIAAVGRFGIDFIVRLSQTIDQITPQRKEELRTAIRKIAREVDLIVEDVKAAQPASGPQPPPNSNKP